MAPLLFFREKISLYYERRYYTMKKSENIQRKFDKHYWISRIRNLEYDMAYGTEDCVRTVASLRLEEDLRFLNRHNYCIVRDDSGEIIDIEEAS